jgi:glyoxylase-like metal-dependent hydrolase (beta-lactamase superfamily II)
MPIKPENRDRYPADWPEIRLEVLERAGHRCERCRARNRTRVARGAGDDRGTYMTDTGDVYDADTGERLGQCRMSDYNVARMTDIVLTIAHLDHTPENVDRNNLRAWCQRCHLAHDREHHAAHAWLTRRLKSGTAELFALSMGLNRGLARRVVDTPDSGFPWEVTSRQA